MPENIGYQFNRLYAAPIETYRQVNTITQRNAIPPEIRWEGMACYVVTENQDYQLVGGVDNSNWVNAGETVSNPPTHFKGFFNATTLTPAISNLNGIEGDEYKVTNGGVNVDFGSGPIFLKTDDIIIFYQSEWMVKVSDLENKENKNSLPLYVSMNEPYRAWQGVVADENYIYTFTDRNASFGLENIIQRYNHNGNFVDEKLTAYSGLDTLGNFMSFGSGYVDDNYVMATVSNSNSPNPDKESKVVRLNKNDLSFIADFDIGEDSSSGLTFYNGSYYISYHDLMIVRKFTTSFIFEEEFSLSRPLETYGGYQSIFFKDGFAFFNYHGANSYGSDYAFGVDKYSFDGSDFTFVENITPPTYGSGQQVSYGNGLYYWADRVENKIIITPSIYQTQKNLISPSLIGLNITVEGEDNPRRILEVDNYADNIGTANVFAFRKARGTKYNPTALIANSLIGGLSFRGHDGIDFNSTSGGVYGHAAENFSNVAHGTYLIFVSTPIGTTLPLEGARLNPNGDFILNRGNSIVKNGLGCKHRSENSSGGYIEVGVTNNATSRGFINFTNGLDIGGGTVNFAGKGNFTGTVIAAPATLSTELVTKGQLDAAARPYKVYTALISQSGTSAPTAKVLENTLGFVPTFGYTSTGVFTVNSSGGFTSDKTYISFTIRNGSITNWIGDHSWSSSSALQITSKNSGVLTNGFPSDAELEIRVYP